MIIGISNERVQSSNFDSLMFKSHTLDNLAVFLIFLILSNKLLTLSWIKGKSLQI